MNKQRLMELAGVQHLDEAITKPNKQRKEAVDVATKFVVNSVTDSIKRIKDSNESKQNFEDRLEEYIRNEIDSIYSDIEQRAKKEILSNVNSN